MRTRTSSLALLLSSLLAACASTGAITPAGKDTFIVAAKARGGMAWSDIKALALSDASRYCEQQKLQMLPIRILTSGVRGWSPQEVDLTFKCLSDDDPDWKNPPLFEERRS